MPLSPGLEGEEGTSPGGPPGGTTGDGAGPQERGASGSSGDAPPKLTDELDWRGRALAAEQRITELEAQVAQAASALTQERLRAQTAHQQASIERSLSSAGAVDIASACVLVSKSLEGVDSPDVPAAVADLKRRIPGLFRASHAEPGAPFSSMSGVVDLPDPVGSLASEARQSGDRRLLMRYLRARRRR